ncbi:hypothetical protein ALC60_03717 [Trachymyrmex zeteki]|uniref:Uncharacterized protein n=1 Tax=Mycetomoellerius zeteki TaxID=64791 RepID=A0A151XAT8_9HYME|nr:PREDICTED: uncharacterized protein C1orf131 homolog [Trachymyrmex zeteki]XP_018300681.1 PREDICTED: uncharacterized protein C1orf131 homolog [Trachymyrmex zeteki]KYQ57398.1 hypothetical protein ALC60_03717 [Trachymyrmex zeteki]
MEDFVPTRGSQVKKTATSDYISVNYTAPKKKVKSADDSNNKEKLKESTKQTPAELKEQQEKEMKKLRYEIIKFGMSGFEKPKARRAKVELAISLGAIPPKNRRMNYKALKMRRKIEKEKEKKKEEGHKSGLTSSLLKPKSKKTRKKDSGILQVYGKVSKTILPKKKG